MVPLAPLLFVTPFTIPNPLTTFTLKIYNGGRAGTRTGERVSSAMISLNSAVIVGAQNFNESIGEIDCVFLTTMKLMETLSDVGQIRAEEPAADSKIGTLNKSPIKRVMRKRGPFNIGIRARKELP